MVEQADRLAGSERPADRAQGERDVVALYQGEADPVEAGRWRDGCAASGAGLMSAPADEVPHRRWRCHFMVSSGSGFP